MSLKKNLVFGIILFLLSTTSGNAFLIKDQNNLYSSDYIKDYLYGSILYADQQHNLAAKSFEKASKLQGRHYDYDVKKIVSLTVNGDLDEAANIIIATEKIYSNIFIIQFIKSVYYLKNKNLDKALFELQNLKTNDPLVNELKSNLIFWIDIDKKRNLSEKIIKNYKSNYTNITLINQFLSSKYVQNNDLHKVYNKEILNSQRFVRYQVLTAWNNVREGNKKKALELINSALINNNKNLLLMQSAIDLKKNNKQFINYFDPENYDHNLSEIFYIFANIFQQRGDHEFSEVLLSISLIFNDKFASNNLLHFENKLIINRDYEFNYLFLGKIKNIGSEYKWYIDYKLALYQKKNINNLEKSINTNNFFIKNKYLDLANYYRINEQYNLALNYYKKIENLEANQNWNFYYFKGICHERLKQWSDAEKNLKKSISLSPKQYSVINYLAYSWLERKENIDEATRMLEDAVKLSNWELGYIIDSLGWAYFLKKDYDKAERLLKIAYEKTPSESEVYDHYGDVLWMQKKYLQARYVWKNAMNLENIQDKRKKKIENKILNGLVNIEKN